MKLNVNKLINYLEKQIEESKKQRRKFADLNVLVEEALWQGELTAYVKVVSFLSENSDNEKLRKIIMNINNY